MSVLGALSDLPSDDPRIFVEFTAIKDTVLEMAKVIISLAKWKHLTKPFTGKLLRPLHNGP